MLATKSWTGALVLLGICLSTSIAKGEYICSADYTPLDTLGRGTNGYILFTTYSGPGCTGTFGGIYNLCTAGATSSACIANTSFHYTNAEILAQAQALRDALIWDVRTSVYISACNGGGSGVCAGHVEFHAN